MLDHSTHLQRHMGDAAEGEGRDENGHDRRAGRAASGHPVIGLAVADVRLRQASALIELLMLIAAHHRNFGSRDNAQHARSRKRALIRGQCAHQWLYMLADAHLHVGRGLRGTIATVAASLAALPVRAHRRLWALRVRRLRPRACGPR